MVIELKSHLVQEPEKLKIQEEVERLQDWQLLPSREMSLQISDSM